MRSESLAFLRRLVDAPSPSGYEEGAATVFREYVTPFSDSVESDVLGSVWGVLNPQASYRVMLAGHIDEIGFAVNHISDDGLLYVKPIGDHDATIPLGQRVWVHARQRLSGAVGRKAVHVLEDDRELEKRPEIHEMWVDIGAGSHEEAAAMVELGDPVTSQAGFETVLGDRAMARGFDNKVGAFVVAEALRLLREEGGLDAGVGVYAVGTVQEEVGFRGAIAAAYAIDAQVGIAVDVSHATDHPGMSRERHGRVELGRGPTVTRGPYINPHVYRGMRAAAEQERIPVQVEVAADCTGTDATAMQTSRAGMACGLLGIPLRYMHTPCELLSLDDVEACARLLAAFCRQLKPDTDLRPSAR